MTVDDRKFTVSGGDESPSGYSRCVVYGLELDDLEAARRCRKLEHDCLTDASSHECLPDRRRHAHVPLLELHRVAEYQAVALTLARLLVLHHYLRAQSDLVGWNLGHVDLRELAQALA